MIVVDFIVMFLSPKYDTLADTPTIRRTFSQIASLAQQLRILIPPIGQAVQAMSVRM